MAAYRVVQLAIGTERHAAGVVIGATGEPIDEIRWLADRTGGRIVCKVVQVILYKPFTQ